MKYTLLLLIIFINACQQNESSQQKNYVQQTQIKACSKEAKICPNGRTVSRNPNNNCEFDTCQKKLPAIKEKLCTADVKQCSDGSFIGRDGFNDCQFKGCPPDKNGRNDLH